jgi:PAS domain S-box-containing protein
MGRVIAGNRAGRRGSTVGALPYDARVPAPDDATVDRAEDEASSLLDALWDSAPVGLGYYDTDLRYRRVNGAVLAHHGGSRDDRIGRTLEEVHGAFGRRLSDLLRAVIRTGEPLADVPLDGRLWHGRGELRELRVSVYPVRVRGEIVGAGMVALDVTLAERSRRELAGLAAQRQHLINRYQSLAEATSAAVWTRAADGSAHADAPRLREISGQDVAAHRGWGWLDAVHPAHRALLTAAWRAAVERAAAGEPAAFEREYRLHTGGGHYRWFRTHAVPVLADGAVVEWVGTETDVDDARRARDRLDVLAGATHAMNAALEPEAELTALADVTVPGFADVCRVYQLDAAPQRRGRAEVSGRKLVTRLAPGIPDTPLRGERFVVGPDHPIARCAHTGGPLLVDIAADPSPAWSGGTLRSGWGRAVSATSMLVAPVFAGGSVVAVLLFMTCGDRPPFTDDDLSLVAELGQRASAAVDAAEAYRRSRQVSIALQAAMLTAPPRHPDVELGVRYLPAAARMQVGGDWYDAFVLPSGELAVGVGDVVGHDLPAAVAMGQLRSMLRGLAHDADADGAGEPSRAVARLDRAVRGLGVTRFATLIYGRITRRGGRTYFRWSNAGHPPPVLLSGGRARALEGVDVVLGAVDGAARQDREVELPPGSTLLLHTDGLTERRADPDGDAQQELLDLVVAGAGLSLSAFCDHVVRGGPGDTGDDIAVLALRPLN